jgi:hypothetical protein
MKEWIEGSGVYRVPVEELPKDAWFVRDPKRYENEEVQPLLHICEQDLDTGDTTTWLILTARVRWDFHRGLYYCTGCKKTWNSTNENGLRAIWSDGLGTGDEGLA